VEPIFSQILNTILMRPYVFVFLLAYLLGCSLHLGVKRAVLFCIAGYVIAWLSEYTSIHTGVPYGHYYYIEHTKSEELWVMGVPFMDSLSYVFLAYASYCMAILVTSPVIRSKGLIYLLETRKIRDSIFTTLLGSIFFVYLDIIIDPVALLGGRWFLGQIFQYSKKGVYFGVPISNFIGWLLVGFLLIYSLQKIDNRLHTVRDWIGHKYPWRYIFGIGLYVGVILFNLLITFYIHTQNLGWAGIFIILLPLSLLFSLMKLKLSQGNIDETLKAHLLDFSQAVVPELPQK